MNGIGTFSVKFQLLLQMLEIHGVNFKPYFFHLLRKKNKTRNLWLLNSSNYFHCNSKRLRKTIFFVWFWTLKEFKQIYVYTKIIAGTSLQTKVFGKIKVFAKHYVLYVIDIEAKIVIFLCLHDASQSRIITKLVNKF